jgi:hypothetical protein
MRINLIPGSKKVKVPGRAAGFTDGKSGKTPLKVA